MESTRDVVFVYSRVLVSTMSSFSRLSFTRLSVSRSSFSRLSFSRSSFSRSSFYGLWVFVF